MRGKFSRFENKAEKCRKKLAIGLTLPNKLTRFRCDAEYQSPRTTATATQGPVSILAGMESDTRRATRHEARTEQNTVGSCGNHCACVMAHGLQQQSDVSLTPATVRVIPRPLPHTLFNPFLTYFYIAVAVIELNIQRQLKSMQRKRANPRKCQICSNNRRKKENKEKRRTHKTAGHALCRELRIQIEKKTQAQAAWKSKEECTLLPLKSESCCCCCCTALLHCKAERERFMTQMLLLLMTTNITVRDRHASSMESLASAGNLYWLCMPCYCDKADVGYISAVEGWVTVEQLFIIFLIFSE